MILEDHPHIDRLIIPSFITKNKKHYLYVHYRQDLHEAFYIGTGTMFQKNDYSRALCYKKRSNFWKKVKDKTRYNVMIIDESDDHQQILDKEINYIKILGKKKDKTGTLVNITDGGEGRKGCSVIWTDEMRKAASERLRHREIKDSTREKHRQNIYKRNLTGRKGKDSYTAKPILQINDLTKEIIREFDSIAQAAEFMNVKSQSISNALKKNRKSCGFKWIYKYGNN